MGIMTLQHCFVTCKSGSIDYQAVVVYVFVLTTPQLSNLAEPVRLVDMPAQVYQWCSRLVVICLIAGMIQ